jgi:hypothetical protein
MNDKWISDKKRKDFGRWMAGGRVADRLFGITPLWRQPAYSRARIHGRVLGSGGQQHGHGVWPLCRQQVSALQAIVLLDHSIIRTYTRDGPLH